MATAYKFWTGDINDAVANNGDRLVRMPDGSVQAHQSGSCGC